MTIYRFKDEIIAEYEELKIALQSFASHDTKEAEACLKYAQFAQACAGIIERYLEERK